MVSGLESRVSPIGSFENMTAAKQFAHFRDFGVFLDGRSWAEQPVKLLAEIEIIRKATILNSKNFDEYTEGERDFMEWLLEDSLNGN